MNAELPSCETLLLSQRQECLTIVLNRPALRNAMNNRMSDELQAVTEYLAGNQQIRALVLRGAEHNFCAGGDIKERRAQVEEKTGDQDPVYERNVRAGQLFKKIAELPQTTIAFVEGAAMGGGFGFACLMDITLVAASAKMGMPETTLGVAPAQIAPYVVRRIGLSKARHMALTGGRISGEEAYQLGVAHYLFQTPEEGEQQLARLLEQIATCGPRACAVTKEIMNAAAGGLDDSLIEFAAERFCELNRGGEGREGQAAFVEKRKARWFSMSGEE